MEQREIAVGLDIGTTKIVTIVGRKNEFNKIEILGFGKAKSLGVQRGVVSNITQTIDSIKHAILDAEATDKLRLLYRLGSCATSSFSFFFYLTPLCAMAASHAGT